MSSTSSPVRPHSHTRAPTLRLLQGHGPALSEPLPRHEVSPPVLRVIDGPSRIMLAGSDGKRRFALLDDLTRTLSSSTVFAHASAICDVLEHAPGSRMVIITGDLDDAPAESLMHMLAHRHPGLPVLIVDSPTRNAAEHVAARHDELRLQHA
jgi:hypothetical protein